MGRNLGFICRERPSSKSAGQGSGEEGRGQIGGKGAIADGDHCLEQNVPRPSLVLGRVPGQEDTCPRAHATLPTFPGDGVSEVPEQRKCPTRETTWLSQWLKQKY